MFIDAEGPSWYPEYCVVCGKEGLFMPSWPIGDACCPYCGSLILCRPRASGISGTSEVFSNEKQISDRTSPATHSYCLLPDTPKNGQEAAEVVAKQAKAW